MKEFSKIMKEAYEGNMELQQNGLVKFSFGNVSVADHDRKVFAIKPSGVAYEKLTPEKMVLVDFDGNKVWGELRPSSDTLTHAVLYGQWKEIGAIVHTHSTYATAWAQALRDVPVYGTTHADHSPHDIPCAPPMEDELIQGEYERETGRQIIRCLDKKGITFDEVNMILLGGHGPFAWGKNVSKAVYHAVILEELCRMALFTENINREIRRLKNSLIDKHYDRKHGTNAYYGQ